MVNAYKSIINMELGCKKSLLYAVFGSELFAFFPQSLHLVADDVEHLAHVFEHYT